LGEAFTTRKEACSAGLSARVLGMGNDGVGVSVGVRVTVGGGGVLVTDMATVVAVGAIVGKASGVAGLHALINHNKPTNKTAMARIRGKNRQDSS
jgi:hypothetical protein